VAAHAADILRKLGIVVDDNKIVAVAESSAGVVNLLATGKAQLGIVYATDAVRQPDTSHGDVSSHVSQNSRFRNSRKTCAIDYGGVLRNWITGSNPTLPPIHYAVARPGPTAETATPDSESDFGHTLLGPTAGGGDRLGFWNAVTGRLRSPRPGNSSFL
jgi:ABC-type molybdate transport system substrate-binding protein